MSLQSICNFDPKSSDFLAMPGKALDTAEEIAKQVWETGWDVVHHSHLPSWLRDNDYLIMGHRPQLNSYLECFRSIFRIHTETGNIWTHLCGFLAFIVLAASFFIWPTLDIRWQEATVFSAYFIGAMACMGFSFLFHTVYCHSEPVGRLFCKLDYVGITLLIISSFIPWLYYSFYCRPSFRNTYLFLIVLFGAVCIFVSMLDKFSEPNLRPVRAALFLSLGLSGLIPTLHYVIIDGLHRAVNLAKLEYILLMGFLYIIGAALYATRFPECVWPGKFDIWFQSHQIFHIFVVAASVVHLYSMMAVARNRPLFEQVCSDSMSDS
jgi:adiponectin receptor